MRKIPGRRFVVGVRVGMGLLLALSLGLGLPARAGEPVAQVPGARGAHVVAAVVQGEAAGKTAGDASSPEGASAQKDQQEVDETDAYRHSPMVQHLGRMVGMGPDLAATVFEVTNFAVLALAVLWGLAKFLPGKIQDRNTAIQKHLVDARTATEEARTRLTGVEARLAKLDDEIAAMRTQADQDAQREATRVKAAIEDEKAKILEAAEQEIAAATAHAQKALQQYAAELAIEQAGRKLVVSAETDRLLVQSFAERLAGDESKKGQN